MRYLFAAMFLFGFSVQAMAADPVFSAGAAKWSFTDGNQYDIVRNAHLLSGRVSADYFFCQTDRQESVLYHSARLDNWPHDVPQLSEIDSGIMAPDSPAKRCTCMESWRYVGISDPRNYILHSGNFTAFPESGHCLGAPLKVTEMPSNIADCRAVYSGDERPPDTSIRYLTTRCDVLPKSSPIGNYRVCFEHLPFKQLSGAAVEIGSATLIAQDDLYKRSQLNPEGNNFLVGYTVLANSCFDVWQADYLGVGIPTLEKQSVVSLGFKLYKLGD